MMPALQSTSLVGANIGRILFIYYILQLCNTPLLLALSFSVVILLGAGFKLWRNFESEPTVAIELIILNAVDNISIYLTISQVVPSTYAFVTLLLFCFSNVASTRSRSRFGALLFGIIGAVIFSINSRITVQNFLISVAANAISLHTRNLSTKSSSKSNFNEFSSALLVAFVTILMSADERILLTLNPSVTIDNLFALLSLWILATTAQWIWKKKEGQHMSQLSHMIVYTTTAIVTALATLDGTQMMMALVTSLMLLIAAYCSISSSSSDDQLSIGDREGRKQRYSATGSYWTLTLMVIAFTLIVSVHVNQFNTRDLRQTKHFNATADFNDRTMPAAERNMYRLQCLHKTRSAYIELLRPHFIPGRNYTIMDYPNHWNLGDAFIYVGQNIMFSIYGQPPVRPPFPHSAVVQALVKNVSVVFLHGGGNFGDIYPFYDNLRVHIVSQFENASIVMMPQSVHYRNPIRLATMVEAYKHNNITMMVRDFESQKFVRGNFTYANAPYVPDSAFMIGAQLPNSDPVVDVLFLLRTDHESSINYTVTSNNPTLLAQQYGLSSERWDFPAQNFPRHVNKFNKTTYDFADIYPGRYLEKDIRPSTESLTWYRTQMGNTMLSRGRVVVADRMHATIMATLIGRPVVYVDNNYRKTSRVRSSLTEFIHECTDAMLDAYYASNISVAVKIAADLIKQINLN